MKKAMIAGLSVTAFLFLLNRLVEVEVEAAEGEYERARLKLFGTTFAEVPIWT